MSITTTTLSGALAADGDKVQIAAAGTVAAGKFARVDDELMKVAGLVGTLVTLARGLRGTLAVAHSSGANFNYGDAADFAALEVGPTKTAPREYFYSAAGAITPKEGTHLLKSGAASAMTLASPSAAEDGLVMDIIAMDAQAYTVTCTAGFNAGGSGLDVATFGGAIGDCMKIKAVGGKWHTLIIRNVALA